MKTSPEASPEVTHTTVPSAEAVVPYTSPPGSPRPERADAPPPRPDHPQVYAGHEGRKHSIATNYLRLEIAPGKGVFEYEVSYEPRVDNRNSRFRLVNQHRDVYGGEKVNLEIPNRNCMSLF